MVPKDAAENPTGDGAQESQRKTGQRRGEGGRPGASGLNHWSQQLGTEGGSPGGGGGRSRGAHGHRVGNLFWGPWVAAGAGGKLEALGFCFWRGPKAQSHVKERR